jgi:prevent-host-death family protein
MPPRFKMEAANGRALDDMTSRDHHKSMKSVRVAELKARLSEYLRLVRKGHPVTVLDRNTPIARIVPVEPQGAALPSRKPTSAVSFWKIPRPPAYRGKIDIVDLLLEERQGER